jgi:adenylate cyclase
MSGADTNQNGKLRKIWDAHGPSLTVGMMITAILSVITFQFYQNLSNSAEIRPGSLIGILDQIYRKTIDFRFVSRGEFQGSDRVAVLAIDDASIDREGRWPWPREKIGKLIEAAIDGGAKIVAFDIVFSEPDPNSAIGALRGVQTDIRGLANQDTSTISAISDIIASKIRASNTDKNFAETIDLYSENIVMGSYFEYESHAVNEALNPFRDHCIDAHYKRYFEQKYWLPHTKQKFGSIRSIDSFITPDHFIPLELIDTLSTYMSSVDNDAIKSWLETNPQAGTNIREALRLIDIQLPAAAESAIIYGSILGDLDTIYFILDKNIELKKYANTFMINQIMETVVASLSLVQKAEIRAKINQELNEYCQRFLTDKDELLDDKKIAALMGVEKIDSDILNTLSFQQAWKRHLKDSSNKESNKTLAQAIENWRKNVVPHAMKNYGRAWISTGELARKTKHSGFFNAHLDPDGTVRRSMLIARRGNHYIPSLALKTFLLDRGYDAEFEFGAEYVAGRSMPSRKVIKSFSIVSPEASDDVPKKRKKLFDIPVDQTGRMLINYAGPQQMFPYINASSLLQNKDKLEISRRATDPKSGIRGILSETVDKKAFLKDKILILGATAIGVYDLRLTPFEENYPGVETHANTLSNLLTEDAKANGKSIKPSQPGFLKIDPKESACMWIVVFAIGTIMAIGLTWSGPLPGLAMTASALSLIYIIDRYFLFNNGYLVNVSIPTFTVFFNFVGITTFKYFTEERKKIELKGTFSKYVSPAVVDEILKDPKNIELGGKKVESTVMFSDVRGFTTISEKLDPRELSNLLNSYLTPMTDLVFETKGTLDKYMGDAIMSFWGAPIPLKDHPQRAATCALLMLQKLKELQVEYQAQGLPNIDIGIGLNTGDMSVGNMGSKTVRSYTVMGDAVNLGSRLEGINKEYGTRIIISEFTQARIASEFVTREVDWVRVKGKAQPVRIFELIGKQAAGPLQADPIMLKLLPEFDRGFKLYHERNFEEALKAFEAATSIKPDDECSKLYIERCQNYLLSPIGENWDGVYTMKTK